MPRVCVTCANPRRAEIDKKLALGSAVKAQIAAELGISESALGRHERECLAPALVEAAKVTAAAESGSLIARVTKMVDRLERLAESCGDYGKGKDLLAAARELRPYHELFGRANGQLANDKLAALFLSVGVRSEDEIKSRLALTDRIEDAPAEDVIEEALLALRIHLPKHPERLQDARRVIESVSYAEVLGGPNGNGNEP